jgi:hypothetical protein
MKREAIKIARRHKKFQEETSLMLSVLWNKNNEYDPFEVNLVNNSVVENYFNDPKVKQHLNCVDGICKNIHGIDVRIVAQNYIQHFILVHEVKPTALS